jgi:hypothetical protein
MEIDDNLKIVCLCPTDGLKKVGLLSIDVRFTGSNIKGPIPNRDAHVIESKIGTTRLDLEMPMPHIAMRECNQARTQQLQFLGSHSQ